MTIEQTGAGFELRAPYAPCGDQPKAIEAIVGRVEAGEPHTILLGVTGSGKTFTIASAIERLGRPALVISHNKTLALRDLAAKTLDGTVPTLAKIRRMDDEAIIEHLTQVRGIGKWTVEMMLIFRLGRADVLPTTDYGVRKGFALTFQGLKPTTKVTPDLLPKPDVMERRAKKWTPWRSVASWYLWRACDLAKPQ